MRLLVPVAAVGTALWAERNDFGLLNLLGLTGPVAFLGAIVLLDLAIYWQHRIFHVVPLFWRLHRVHHADEELDVTTGVRFHPIEIVLSALIKIAVVALLGAGAVAVMLFEILLNATSMFNHANIRLPLALDRVLRLVIVTPDMHRVHHSVHMEETNSNYGFNLTWWDRLFGSYIADPRDGHNAMLLGLHEFRADSARRLGKLLSLPWR